MESPDFIELCLPHPINLELLDNVVRERIKFVIDNKLNDSDLTIRNIFQDGISGYSRRISPILEEYKNGSPKPQKRKLKLTQIKKNTTKDKKEYDLIIRFVNIARDYINIKINDKFQRKAKCPGCQTPFEHNDVEETLICEHCGYESQSFASQNSMTTSANYVDSINFVKKMQRKQGKIHNPLPDDLFDKLDEYCLKIDMLSGQEIRNKKQNKKGEKRGTSLDILIEALSVLNLPKLYNDVDYIAHIYWGWSLLNFTAHEEELMDIYQQTQIFYPEVKGAGRMAALNTEVRLYLQLKTISHKLNFKIFKSRFRFQESQESLEFHQHAWRVMCERSGLEYFSII